jgi:hypothetical protein
VCKFTTIGELKLACRWMECEFDGSIDVIYRRNTSRGYMPFMPADTVAEASQVVVTMQKPGFDSRVVGIFRVTETGPESEAPLMPIGQSRCAPVRWIIMLRLAMSSTDLRAITCD